MTDSDQADGEFVSIADAALALGITDRAVRRRAETMPSGTVRKFRDASGRFHRMVHLPTLRNLRDGVSLLETPVLEEVEAPEVPPGSGTVRKFRQVPTGSATFRDSRDETIERQQEEIAFLRGALEREQETARAALVELQEARRQQAVMIAAVAAGKIERQRLDAPTASPAPEPASPAPASLPVASKSEKRPWWAIWKKI